MGICLLDPIHPPTLPSPFPCMYVNCLAAYLTAWIGDEKQGYSQSLSFLPWATRKSTFVGPRGWWRATSSALSGLHLGAATFASLRETRPHAGEGGYEATPLSELDEAL